MRPALLFCALLVGSALARAEDPRVTLLSRQLKGAMDPRVKSQAVLLLGQTKSADAVAPLCGALKDPDVIVRNAAAEALGELKNPTSVDCLKTALGEPDPTVRAALERAVASLAGPAPPPPPTPNPSARVGALYVNLEPIQDKVGGLPDTLLQLTDKVLREKLSTLGAVIAPPSQERSAAATLIKNQRLRGFQLRVQLHPGATETGLKVEMLIMTYPEQSLKGSWAAKASGGKPEAQIKALVPRVVDDAAGDLEWLKD